MQDIIKNFLVNYCVPYRDECIKLLEDNLYRFETAWGSSHNHQAWEGGYLDHVVEVMTIAHTLYFSLLDIRSLPFKLSDAFLVLFLHDLEKPWKKELGLKTKAEKRKFREDKIKEYNIILTLEQQNALLYVEGEGDDYRSDKRVMNELATFCHICDVTSARIWHDEPGRKITL